MPATYTDSGPPVSPITAAVPVMLLPSTTGGPRSDFWAVSPMLTPRHRVISVEFADPPASTGELDELDELGQLVAQAAAVVATANGGAAVNVVGYGSGALVAAALAADRPDLVENLVLVAGWVKPDRFALLHDASWLALSAADPQALADFIVLTEYSPGFVAGRTTLEYADLRKAVRAGTDRSRKVRLTRSTDLSDRLPRITADTLVVGCAEDRVTPVRHAHLLFGGLERARYAEIAAGHAVVHERPAEVVALIDDFLAAPTRFAAGSVITGRRV